MESTVAALGSRTMHLVALRLAPQHCNTVRKALSQYVLKTRRVKPIQNDGAHPGHKLLLLNEDVSRGGVELDGLPSALRDVAMSHGAKAVAHTVEVGFDNLTVAQALRELLPASIPDDRVPSSFETIGHIARLVLHPEHLPYRYEIGKVFLAKNSRLRTVVNKTSSISTQFRTFPMEVIAGDDDMEAEIKENDATFTFDFSKVYWNSRLQREHARIVDSLADEDIVCDMMAGIGPFAVPAALRSGATIYANDLNPDSHRALIRNVRRNGVGKSVTCSNLDAREFARDLMQRKIPFTRVLMNLPDSAISFLDVFAEKLAAWPLRSGPPWPTVHCYCFSSAEGKDAQVMDVKQRVEDVLKVPLTEGEWSVHFVRDVAPRKMMLCITFVLPVSAHAIAPAGTGAGADAGAGAGAVVGAVVGADADADAGDAVGDAAPARKRHKGLP